MDIERLADMIEEAEEIELENVDILIDSLELKG